MERGAGADIVGHVRGISRSWNDAGHRRMSENEGQQQLRPTRAADRSGEVWQRLLRKRADEGAAAERAIDKNGDPAGFRDGKQPLRGLEIVERIIELNEIDGRALHDIRKIVESAAGVVRDADIADAPVFLPAGERIEMRAPVDEIMDLHQIETLRLQERERALHLRDAGGAAAGPDLGRNEGALLRTAILEELARHV